MANRRLKRQPTAKNLIGGGSAKPTVPAIPPGTLPLRPGCTLSAALGDGEDYELVFALAARTDTTRFKQAWTLAFPRTQLTCIGRFVAATKLPLDVVDLTQFHGYEHLKQSLRS